MNCEKNINIIIPLGGKGERFIKNGYTAKFGTCADATGIKLPEDTAATGKVYQYILYKKKGVQDQDNNANFQMYDMNIQKEIKKIKNNEI